MSHYTVMVITDDGDYETALEPFDESIEIEPYIDITREEIIANAREDYRDYQEGNYNNPEYFQEKWGDTDFNNDDAIIKRYMEFWGDECSFDEDGNELTTYNPKAKWDWYALGGRWSGSLKLKAGSETIKDSEPPLFSFLEVEEGYTDHAQVKDIDLSPNTDMIPFYERYWQINVEGSPMTKEEEESKQYDSWYNSKHYLEKYGDRDTYIKDQINLNTYAILYHGEWIEPGKMGWFGCSSANSSGYAEYRKKALEIMANLNPEDYISIVDCHI